MISGRFLLSLNGIYSREGIHSSSAESTMFEEAPGWKILFAFTLSLVFVVGGLKGEDRY